MSSELIGELGQVGLKIGEPTAATLTGTNDCYSDEKKKPRLQSNHRPKKFRQAWMMFDIFKDWLRPHSSPEFATCIVCNRVIKAGKSELEKHAAGKRHQMLRGNNSHSTNTTVLLDQELITPGELPVSISINDGSPRGSGGNANAATVEEYAGITCMDTASYNSFTTGDNGGNHTDAFQQSVPRQQATVQAPVVQEMVTKAIVSKAAPPWKATAIVNGHITKLDLLDYRGRYLILLFYPQDFNRICASEINGLSDRIGEFRSSQAEIVACSVDSHLCHLAWSKVPRQEGGIGNPKIPLLADPTHSIAKDYGVFAPDKGHALRGSFIIDKKGILRVMNMYDMLIGRGIDELLRTIRALQFTDDADEGVPADWAPPHIVQ